MTAEEKVLGSPIRRRILVELKDGRVLAPVRLAEVLEEELGVVAYHVRVMVSLGLLELVEKVQVRGAVEHRYRLGVGGQAIARLVGPRERTYGVCVGGGMASPGDEYRDPMRALARAEELAADGYEVVQIILWTEPLPDGEQAAEDAAEHAAAGA